MAKFGGSLVFNPSAGGSHALHAIKIESATPEERSNGNVTGIFFDGSVFTGSIPFPARGDSIVLSGSTYKITNIESDAENGVRVLLRKS